MIAPHRLVITGASGYIGSRLLELARAQGCEVLVLGSRPSGSAIEAVPWRLGEVPSRNALAGATAIIHLGHSWASDAAAGTGPDNINLQGAVALACAACGADVPRFVFASTTSARALALNAYGRIKHSIEAQLSALAQEPTRILNARIGLVYGGPERGLYGLLSRIVGFTGWLPMIGLDREVQPIHIDEVCVGLLRLALDPPSDHSTFVLAGAQTMTFGAWLRMLRRARTGRSLVLIRVPIRIALWACDLTRLIPFIPTIDRERVLGLAGAEPMVSADDLAALSIIPRDPLLALAATPVARRRLIAEAAVMLGYVAGKPIRSPSALIHLTRAMACDSCPRRAIPTLARRWPALLRLLEPIRPSMRHGLSRHLHLAAMVVESLPAAHLPTTPGFATIAMQLMLEGLALPFRLFFSRLSA